MRLKLCENTGEEDKVLLCNELNNDILFRMYHVEENVLIRLQEYQLLLLLENGRVLDVVQNTGYYQVVSEEADKKDIPNEWENVCIQKGENEPLSILFINQKMIEHNKYFIEEPIKYKEYHGNNIKEYNIKISGRYDFYIENPKKFLLKVIGLRNHFSKQELIEQTRKYAIKSIEDGINELSEEYKLNVDMIKTKSKELAIQLRRNEFDEKLSEYGIKITYFDIETLELMDKKKKKFFK